MINRNNSFAKHNLKAWTAQLKIYGKNCSPMCNKERGNLNFPDT